MNSGARDCMANDLTNWAKFLVCHLLKSFLAQFLPLFGFMCRAISKCVSFTITPTKTSLKCSFKSPIWNRLIFAPSFLFFGNVSYETATLFPHTLLRVGNKLLACWQLGHESLVSVACPFTWSVGKEVTSTLLLSHPIGLLSTWHLNVHLSPVDRICLPFLVLPESTS